MTEADMGKLAGWMADALEKREDPAALDRLRAEVETFCGSFPVPGI